MPKRHEQNSAPAAPSRRSGVVRFGLAVLALGVVLMLLGWALKRESLLVLGALCFAVGAITLGLP